SSKPESTRSARLLSAGNEDSLRTTTSFNFIDSVFTFSRSLRKLLYVLITLEKRMKRRKTKVHMSEKQMTYTS
ncbi:hypothetical protein PENTCL1PPCAC_30438, partial [Pristionchus entomophagus]